jgi:hypothetical protein
MKSLILGVAIAASAMPAMAQSNVSISVGQPGFYGRIDIGDYGPPPVVYERPVIIRQAPVEVRPVYLRVPPGHRKHWSRYCGSYRACGQPVYFVTDEWYTRTYVPRYREEHRGWREERHEERGHGHGKGHGRGHGHGHD